MKTLVQSLPRWLTIVALSYWGLFALLAPVTVWDAQVYNLGRLPIALAGGLFHNPLWTTPRQIAFPLSFDAIHLPFLYLGAGFGLPSFLCFLGTIVVVWRTLARWHGTPAGWIGTLALLGLPTLVFQAVGTKNDIPILFGVAVWFHAMTLYQEHRRTAHLVFGALAIGFMAGAKSTGLLTGLFCALFSFWLLRGSPRSLFRFALLLLPCLVVLGSTETYIANLLIYRHALGPEAFVRKHRNNDAIRGGIANAVRYTLANINTGLNRVTQPYERLARTILRFIRLPNVGYCEDFNDDTITFLKNGVDATSDYGPVGSLALAAALVSVFWWHPRASWWRLNVFGLLVMGAICYTVAWMPWNDRFLMVPFAVFTVALVSWLQSAPRFVVGAFIVVCAGSAIAFPLRSFNKKPSDLLGSVLHRERQEFKERLTLLPVMQSLREWRSQHPAGEVFFLAGDDSWVLPFLMASDLRLNLVSESALSPRLAEDAIHGRPAALLVLNRPDFRTGNLSVDRTRDFPEEPATALYEAASRHDSPRQGVATWVSAGYGEGWSSDRTTIAVNNSRRPQIALELRNPALGRCTVWAVSSIDQMEVALAPNERKVLRLAVAKYDMVTVNVLGDHRPAALSSASDAHQASLQLQILPP